MTYKQFNDKLDKCIDIKKSIIPIEPDAPFDDMDYVGLFGLYSGFCEKR